MFEEEERCVQVMYPDGSTIPVHLRSYDVARALALAGPPLSDPVILLHRGRCLCPYLSLAAQMIEDGDIVVLKAIRPPPTINYNDASSRNQAQQHSRKRSPKGNPCINSSKNAINNRNKKMVTNPDFDLDQTTFDDISNSSNDTDDGIEHSDEYDSRNINYANNNYLLDENRLQNELRSKQRMEQVFQEILRLSDLQFKPFESSQYGGILFQQMAEDIPTPESNCDTNNASEFKSIIKEPLLGDVPLPPLWNTTPEQDDAGEDAQMQNMQCIAGMRRIPPQSSIEE
ncbi:hypothetical protein TRFO_00953 [Tritrichomonas foetus]|uniref:Ubiquitin-like domain-containing protein n=1 Tax=Tritrichomonas foetus TaxID=1144522 RepID=A0A1J4L6T5_9EUKA|nr:hypothetical protein TRFO_00953 [Tritrichomonas foetus]|eukprot:OHT17662.1 hypothetical protein TRFO_00953 [Tritrichomonas foetus]